MEQVESIPHDETAHSTGDHPPQPATAEGQAIASGEFRRLDPRSIQAERIAWAILIALITLGILIVIVIDLVAGWFDDLVRPFFLVGAGLFLLFLAWMCWKRPEWSYRHTSYAVNEIGIQIRRGIWWKRVIDVPRSRVQHTDVLQGPIARSFGLGKLVIHTAGTQYATVELDGLAHETALEIRDYLIRGSEADAV